MSPRTGRPKAENPKEFSLKIRFDRELNDRLDAFCQDMGIEKQELTDRLGQIDYEYMEERNQFV